jgi:hypothetical protein
MEDIGNAFEHDVKTDSVLKQFRDQQQERLKFLHNNGAMCFLTCRLITMNSAKNPSSGARNRKQSINGCHETLKLRGLIRG